MSVIIPFILIFGTSIGLITFFLIKSIISPKKIESLNSLLKQNKAAAVTKSAKMIIQKNPRDTDAHYLLGLAYIAENKPELALMEFKAVNQIGEFTRFCKEEEFRQKISELFKKFNQPEEALKEYLMLIKLDPANAEYYYLAGELFEERNKNDKASNYYRKAIELDPKHSNSHFKLGLILYKEKKPLEAKMEVEIAIKLQPDNYKAYYYYGKLLKENHDYTGALVAFEKAQRDPEIKIKSLVERGGCYMSSGNLESAIAELERAVRLSQDESSTDTLYARYFLSLCYERNRQIDNAIEQWEKIYSKKNSFKDVAEKLSQYQDLRTDDRIKDYLTTNKEGFYELCAAAAAALGLGIRDQTDLANGCQLIAVEAESTKWRNARKMPVLVRFYRIPEMIPESSIRSMHEDMKKLGITKGIIVSSSNFSKKAYEYAETRPINLVDKDKLQELLTSGKDSSALPNT